MLGEMEFSTAKKNGVWEDKDSESLGHKTATEMPTPRGEAGRAQLAVPMNH